MNLSILDPYRWVIAVAFIAACFLGIQFWKHRLIDQGYDKAVAQYAAAAVKASEKSRLATARMQKEKDDAEVAAAERMALQKRDADRLRSERDGLRRDLATSRDQLSRAPIDAVREYAVTAADVFEQCVARYADLAEKADGHSSDTEKMIKSWPK